MKALFVSATTKPKAKEHAAYKKISPQEAKVQLDSEDEILLVDVRSPEEYKERHIANSLLLPGYDIEEKAPELLPDKDAKIFVYCLSGRRACGAVKHLIKLGYTDVTDIGGIQGWPYETVSE